MNVARPDALRIVRTIAACLSVMSSRTGSSRTVAAYRVADKLTQHADPMGKPNRPQCQPEHRPPPPPPPPIRQDSVPEGHRPDDVRGSAETPRPPGAQHGQVALHVGRLAVRLLIVVVVPSWSCPLLGCW